MAIGTDAAADCRKLIAEYLTVHAEEYFLENGVDYAAIPRRKWASVKASLLAGQKLKDAILSPSIDPIAGLAEKSFLELNRQFQQVSNLMKQIDQAQATLIAMMGPEKEDIERARKTPACLVRAIVERMKAGHGYETALAKAKPNSLRN